MSGHTKGPWLIDGQTVYALVREGRHDVNRFSARVQSSGLSAADDAECEANARVMATAPDLLEALRELDPANGHRTDCNERKCGDCSTCRARAAIRKATT